MLVIITNKRLNVSINPFIKTEKVQLPFEKKLVAASLATNKYMLLVSIVIHEFVTKWQNGQIH